MTLLRYRGFVEWDISGIPDGSTVTKVEFRYHGKTHNANASNTDIRDIVNQPSVIAGTNPALLAADCIDGTAYLSNNAVFPEVGVTKDIGGASGPAWDTDPKGDVETALINDWFAIGMVTQETETPGVNESFEHEIYSEEKTDAANPKPTLYVEYTLPNGVGVGAAFSQAAAALLT